MVFMKIEEIKELCISSKKLEGNCNGIYFLFDEQELVYIGRGWNCLLRVAEHTRKDSDKKFTSWNYMYIENNQERNNMERTLIQTYKPKYNKALKTK